MFVKAISTLALAAVAIAQSLQINTPASLVTCQPAALSWSGGTAPYFVAVIPGGQSSAAALKDFGQQSGTSLTWTVDIAAGTSVSLKITDSTGNVNYNQAVTIQQGSTTSCIGAAASGSSAAASGSASSAAGSASSAAGVVASASSATSAAASAASSARASATGAVSSAASAAASGASSVRSAAASGASAASSAVASAAASSGAASPFAVAPVTGFLAVVAAVVGVAF